MTDSNLAGTIIPPALGLVVIGLAISRSDSMIFGLSSDFFAGFMMSAGLTMLLLSLAVSLRSGRA